MTATFVAFVMMTLVPFARQQPTAAGKPQSISGRVVDGTTGAPVNGAVVVLWARSADRPSGRRLPVVNGVFEIPDVSPGRYTIAAEVPGAKFSYRTETVDVEIRDSNITGLGLIITPFGPRPVTVAGTLVMEGGGTLPASITRIHAGAESSAVQRDGSFQLRFRAEEKYSIRMEVLPEGVYVQSVSAGSWNASSEVLAFSSTPPSTLRINLIVGNRTLRGRVLDKTLAPVGSQAELTFSALSSAAPVRRVPVNADGTFEVGRLRTGEYQLKARTGLGGGTQFVTLPVTIANADRNGIEVVLKGMTPQKGRVVIEGAGRIEDLLRFRPAIEVTDILGVHRLPINTEGTFEFQSFVGEYSVAIRDVPPGYDITTSVAGSSVEIKLRVVQGDGFRFLRVPRQR